MIFPDLVIICPIWDVSGVAETARNLYLALIDLGAKVKLVELGGWSHLKADLSPEVRDKIQMGLDRNDLNQPAAIHFYPPDPFRGTANIDNVAFNVNWSVFETDKCPILWREMLNDQKFLECWVPSKFNIEAYASQGVNKQKLRWMPLGVDTDKYNPKVTPLNIQGKNGFTIMTALDWSERKNPEGMVKAYLEEFNKQDDVTFVIKSYTGYGDENSKNFIRNRIKQLRAMVRSNAKIVLITDFIHSDLMPSFHKAADVWLNLSRGEGWDMGSLQSMASEVPVIGSDSSSHLMYLDVENGYPVQTAKIPIVNKEFLSKSPQFLDHNWWEPNLRDARKQMRQAYNDWKDGKLAEKGKLARQSALNFKWKDSALNTLFHIGKYYNTKQG